MKKIMIVFSVVIVIACLFAGVVNANYQDIILRCKECGKDFVITAGEQAFYDERGFKNYPERCRDCKNAKICNPWEKMRWYDAVCAGCGKKIKVGFKTIEGRPVFCVECHRNQND